METKITDNHGNKVGSVEQWGNDYIIRDRHGIKSGTAEKEILGNDYNLYDERGRRVGKTDADLLGKGVTIRDNMGRKVGRVEPLPGMGNGAFIAILVAGILIFISFKKIPEHLAAAVSGITAEFFVITLPVLVFAIINIVEMIRGKGSLFQDSGSYMTTLIMEVLHGVITYFCGVAILFLEGWLIEGINFFEALIMSFFVVLVYAASFLVLLLPLALIFAGLIMKRSRGRSRE